MPWLRHFALFLVFVAALFRPAAAGAFVSAPDANAQARVGAFELVTATLVGPASAATCRLHEGIGAAYDENASGYRFAAGGVNGSWVRAAESMSERAAAYQARFGRVGEVFHVNGVKFDGVVNGVLQEAKGPGYATFVRNGSFQPWFRGADALVDQARRQVAAAGGAPIQWHFAEEAAAKATRSLFTERGVTGIQVLFTP
jgi:hypothetical protein